MSRTVADFVDATGSLKNQSCIVPFANLMNEERNYVRQTLLLRIASSSKAELFSSFVHNNTLLTVLQNWLTESIENESPIAIKILEFLEKLDFSVEVLKSYKFGKLIKKLTTSTKKGFIPLLKSRAS